MTIHGGGFVGRIPWRGSWVFQEGSIICADARCALDSVA